MPNPVIQTSQQYAALATTVEQIVISYGMSLATLPDVNVTEKENGSLLRYDSTTGKFVADEQYLAQNLATIAYVDAEIAALGSMSLQNSNNVSISGGIINGVAFDGGTY